MIAAEVGIIIAAAVRGRPAGTVAALAIAGVGVFAPFLFALVQGWLTLQTEHRIVAAFVARANRAIVEIHRPERAMAKIATLFPTRLYSAQLRPSRNGDLARTCLGVAADDRAGQRWAKAHDYEGYTSYASLDDLVTRASVFAELERDIAGHVRAFARALDYDRRLALDSLWINVMQKGGIHTAHIHPHAAISGTYYVTLPKGAAAIRFEDPRLAMMMAAPPRKERARPENRSFVTVAPKPGMLLLWESFLRHEVPPNRAKGNRISISFNYA